MLNTTLVGRVVSTLSTNFLLLLLGIGTSTLAARLLGPEGRGELAGVQNITAFVSLLALLGLPDAVTYMTGQDRNASGKWLVTAAYISEALALPLVIIAIIYLPTLVHLRDETLIMAGRFYMLSVFPYIAAALPYNSLQGALQISFWNTLRIVGPGLWLLALLFAWATSSALPISAAYVLEIYLIALVIQPIIIIPCTVGLISRPFKFSVAAARRLMLYGIPSFLGVVPQQLSLRLDQLAMALFLPPSTLGIYVVSVAWSTAVPSMTIAAGQMAFPSIANLPPHLQCGVVGQIMRGSIVLALLLTGSWGILTPFIFLPLMGGSYRPSLHLMALLIPAAGISAINSVSSQVLKGLGKPQCSMLVEVGGLITTVALLFFLLGPYQLVGASVACFGSFSVAFMIAIYFISRVTGLSFGELIVPRIKDWETIKQKMILSFSKGDKSQLRDQ